MGLAGRCLIHLYAGLLADLQDAHLPLSKAPTAEAEGSDEILAGCDFITHPFVQPLPTFLSTGGAPKISHIAIFSGQCVSNDRMLIVLFSLSV